MTARCDISGCNRPIHSVSMGLCVPHTRHAWEQGLLARKLHPIQRIMRDEFYASEADETVWNCARRLGKTFLLLILAFETALRSERAQIKFAAQTATDVRNTIAPMVDKILMDCPDSLMPVARWHQHRIEFRNGSEIIIAGCDKGNFRHLRGQEAHLAIVDEGGFVDQLEHVVDSVLWPQTWTTKGKILLASTPPETVGHHFQQRYLQAKSIGASQRFTFYDNPLLSDEDRARIIAKAAKQKGMSVDEYIKSTHWLREGLAEFVTDTERAVLPEYTEAREQQTVSPVDSRPIWVDRYTVMDLGATRDWTAIVYAYLDFQRGKLVIGKERKLLRPGTKDIARAISEDEEEFFPRNPMPETRHFRFMDGNDILIRDLAADHELLFVQTEKDDRDAAILGLRNWIATGKLEIDPSCTHLTAQMRAAIWNKTHTDFERIEGFGHFDFVAALIYLVRNVIPNANRLPPHYGKSHHTHWIGEESLSTEEEALESFLS